VVYLDPENVSNKLYQKIGNYSPVMVRQWQQALNDISTRHAVGLYWVPGHAGVRGNDIADKLAKSGFVQRFVGLESFLGVSRQNIRYVLQDVRFTQ